MQLRPFFLLLLLSACGATAKPVTQTPTRAVAPKEVERKVAFGPANIDAALRDEWKKANVTPANPADDATFLRRAYLDIAGTIPSLEATQKFLDDKSPAKRARLIDTLRASPEYANHWMNYWDDVLMGREVRGNLVDRAAFRYWLRAKLAANTPWDRLVNDLISATGQNGVGGPKSKGVVGMATPMGSTSGEDEEPDLAAVNGAVNWTLRFEQNPQDLGGSASRVFLGVQIQCAQCHDHKTEKWKQDDFRRFSSAFFRAKVEPIDRGKPMGSVKRVELHDSDKAQPRFAKNAELTPIVKAKATALDGTDLEKGTGTRKALAAWMTSKQNPWFAKAFVNRMWGHYLGRGFYDPVDDMRPSNPATAPELLDRIAADFIAHDFDVKYLVRTICATEAYQLSASSTKTDEENKLWGRFHLVPLGPEELLNAIFRATDLDKTAQKAGIKDLDALRVNIVRQYAFLFDVDEENDEPDYSGTVSQALALLNGALVGQSARALPGSMVSDLEKSAGTDAEKVDLLAVRVLSRHATPEERDRWTKYISEADSRAADAAKAPKKKPAGKSGPLDRLANRKANVTPKQAAYEDIVWSMLNSSEFTFNH